MREMAEETSEDRRDTDRDEAGDIDVDCLLLGKPDEKKDPIQHELESRAAMAGWKKHSGERFHPQLRQTLTMNQYR